MPGIYTDFTPYELVSSQNAGIFVKEDWGAALITLLDNTILCNSIFMNALQYINEERNHDQQVRNWKSLFEEM